jgi:hypothetical protein
MKGLGLCFVETLSKKTHTQARTEVIILNFYSVMQALIVHVCVCVCVCVCVNMLTLKRLLYL